MRPVLVDTSGRVDFLRPELLTADAHFQHLDVEIFDTLDYR